MASAGLGSTGPLFFGVGANPPPSSDPSIQELKKKEMKQKGELKVYSADSDVAQSGSRTKTRTKARTVVLDSKYQLGDEVGRGSSGKVYKALNRDTGDFRAIKEIPIRDVPVARLQAVQTEIEVLHTMQHEKIVHYFETIRTDSHLYLVLEYMENGSLAGVVRKYGCFPEALVAMYMRQVLDGLEWLHSHGVCHGDVKGANLLITKEGHVKLADFGVARRLSDATEQGAPSSVVRAQWRCYMRGDSVPDESGRPVHARERRRTRGCWPARERRRTRGWPARRRPPHGWRGALSNRRARFACIAARREAKMMNSSRSTWRTKHYKTSRPP